MVLKPVGTQNTPKKQYNMDTRIAKNLKIPLKNSIIWIRELQKIRQKYHNRTMTLGSLSDCIFTQITSNGRYSMGICHLIYCIWS